MARALADRTVSILANMPPYYSGDPATIAVIDACAREVDRLWDMLESLQEASCPQLVTDQYGLLSLWEYLEGLPVAPVGITEAQRRAKVASWQRRKVASGEDWAAALTDAIGPNWTQLEAAGQNVLIVLPTPAGSYDTAVAILLARRITPAHIVVSISYSASFFVGVNKLGDPL